MRVDPTRWTFLNLLSPHLQKHRDPPQDALVGWFTGPEGRPYAMLVNQLHGQGKSARDTADTIELEFSPAVTAVEAVGWLDGTPGALVMRDGRASLRVAGGTGVLLRFDLARSPEPETPEPSGQRRWRHSSGVENDAP